MAVSRGGKSMGWGGKQASQLRDNGQYFLSL